MFDFLRNWQIRRKLGCSGQYLPVQNKQIYYEVYGSGEPVLMFHGGLSTLETYRKQIPELSKHFRLILPERTGNGHTADDDKPCDYEAMADEMIAFMDIMKLSYCKVMGYSDGANLLFFMAKKRPDLIERMVLIGGNFHHEGSIESFQEELRAVPEGSVGEYGIDERYAKYSPDGPDHYAVVYGKIRKLWLTQPTLKAEDISSIKIPSLVVSGDKDVISMEHTLEMYNALPHSELCVLPHTTHGIVKEKPKIMNDLLIRFLKQSYFRI